MKGKKKIAQLEPLFVTVLKPQVPECQCSTAAAKPARLHWQRRLAAVALWHCWQPVAWVKLPDSSFEGGCK